MVYLSLLKKLFIKDSKIYLKKEFCFLVYDQKVIAFPIVLYDLILGKVLVSNLSKGFFDKVKMFKTYNSILKSNLQGLSKNFYEVLILKGIGFRASMLQGTLNLEVGFSHKISLKVFKTLKVFCPTKTSIFVAGRSLEEIKKFCSLVQRQKKVDLYKGKGIFFRTKVFRVKAFKK